MKKLNNKFYNWQKTQSYNARVNMIITMRGYGKTYGLRKFAVKDYLKTGNYFAVITRFKTSLEGQNAIQRGFFDKLVLNNEFPDHIFKTEGKLAYISYKPVDKGQKPEWKLFGYFLALTEMQNSKERTFVNINTIIFDEFIIDKRTRSRYLQGEFNLFINAVDSLLREVNGEGTKAHIYLLGNSCDLSNPYFARFGITSEPPEGYSWHNNKTVLVHYAKDKIWSNEKRKTLVGLMIAGTKEENIIIDNEFANSNNDYIAKKPKYAKFKYGLIYKGDKYGVWFDERNYLIFINNKIVKNSKNIYSLTTADNRINYLITKKTDPLLRSLVDLYYHGVIRYENNYIYEQFNNLLSLFGIL